MVKLKPQLELIQAYVDSAKSFVQLSSAALVVPGVLRTDMLGAFHRDASLPLASLVFVCISWVLFLASIGAGLLYQYAAIKYLEYIEDPETYVHPLLRYLVVEEGPGVTYGVMIATFYAGAIALVVYSALGILGGRA